MPVPYKLNYFEIETGIDSTSTLIHTGDLTATKVKKYLATSNDILLGDGTTASLSGKQNTITLTTTGTSGASTLIGATLNIPNYADGGVLSLSAIGAVPNANAATITGTVLNLQPADASFGGVVTTGVQTFAGAKTLSVDLNVNSLTVGRGGGSAIENTAVGSSALSANNTTYVTAGLWNTAFGSQALSSNSATATLEAFGNSAFGYQALYLNTIGVNNTAVGRVSLTANTTGQQNTALGTSSLTTNSSGDFNTAIGNSALWNLTIGSNNTAIGRESGSGITTGSGNTILGANVASLAAGLTNNIILAIGTGSIKAQYDGTNWTFTGGATITGQLSLGSTITNGTYTYTLPSETGTLAIVGGSGVGTVTSVAALTLGTTGTDLSSTVANSTTTPSITLNVPTASASARGALSAADWTTFNSKQIAGNYITSLTGEATASGPGAAAITLTNSAVIAKVLTGLNVTGGTVIAADTILAAFGKVQNQINGLIGGSVFQGVWNASTNTPALVSSVGTNGHYYIVSVAGSTNLDGITDWQVGDWAIFAGTSWQKVDNTDAVSSVNGFTGAVSLTTDNVPEGATNLYFTNTRARTAISLTTTGSSGASTYDNTTGVFNIPTYTDAYVGTVTSVGLSSATSGVTIGSTPVTTSGTITIAIATATTLQNGLLSSTDWTTFNNKQGTITLTTTGTSGAATFISNTLNIPDYGAVLTGYVPYTGANQTLAMGTNNGITLTDTSSNTSISITSSSTGQGAILVTKSGNGEGIRVLNGGIGSGFLSANTSTGIGFYINNSSTGIGLKINNDTSATGDPFIYTLNNVSKAKIDYLGNITGVAGTFTGQLTLGSTITNGTYTYTLPGATGTLALVGGAGVGTVTSVAALTLGTTGTDLSSTVANGTTTPVITLQVPTASATNRGALSSTDWSTFNSKQGTITLTTTGTSGAATFSANTLNIPNYADGGVLSLSAIGGTANANGATITGTVLNLQPADASFGGVVTTGVQTFAGAKTLTGALSGTSASMSLGSSSVPTAANSAFYPSASTSNTAYSGTYYDGSTAYSSFFGRVPSSISSINDGLGYVTISGVTPTLRVLFSNSELKLNVPLSGTSATFSSTVTAVGYSKFWDATQGLYIGAFSGGSGFGALYPVSVTPSSTNHAFAASSGATILNTGSSGVIDLEINTTSALYINNSRNVGIGTTAPGAPLSFADTNALKIQLNGGAGNYYGIEKQAAVSGGDGLFKFESGKTSAGEFAFSTGGTQRLLIASTGAATFSSSVTATKFIVGTDLGYALNITTSGFGAILQSTGSSANIPLVALNSATSGVNNIISLQTDAGVERLAFRYDRTGDRIQLVAAGSGFLFTGAATFSGDLTANVGTITFTNAANIYMKSVIREGTTGNAFFQYSTDTRFINLNGAGKIAFRNNANSSDLLTISDAGAATFSSSVTATSLIKSGGTAAQYLMADGSTRTTSSNAYTLKDWYASGNNVSSTETDLMTYTVPANTLVNNGDKLSFTFGGIFGSVANSKTLRVYFGTTSVVLNSITEVNVGWQITGTIIKDSATTYRFTIVQTNINYYPYTMSGTSGTVTNYTGTNVFKITGQGTSSSDLTAQMGTLQFIPAG